MTWTKEKHAAARKRWSSIMLAVDVRALDSADLPDALDEIERQAGEIEKLKTLLREGIAASLVATNADLIHHEGHHREGPGPGECALCDWGQRADDALSDDVDDAGQEVGSQAPALPTATPELTEEEIQSAERMADRLGRDADPGSRHDETAEAMRMLAASLRSTRARLAEAKKDLSEHFALSLEEGLAHDGPNYEDCPTYFDGCNCTLGALVASEQEYQRVSAELRASSARLAEAAAVLEASSAEITRLREALKRACDEWEACMDSPSFGGGGPQSIERRALIECRALLGDKEMRKP